MTSGKDFFSVVELLSVTSKYNNSHKQDPRGLQMPNNLSPLFLFQHSISLFLNPFQKKVVISISFQSFPLSCDKFCSFDYFALFGSYSKIRSFWLGGEGVDRVSKKCFFIEFFFQINTLPLCPSVNCTEIFVL